MTPHGGFVAIVPVKDLRDAKSRLALPARSRRGLALAMADDTVSAVRACPEVEAVWVVTADARARQIFGSRGAGLLADRGGGMCGSADAAHAVVSLRHPACATVVIPADLPALTPEALGELLVRAGTAAPAFVRDARGDGTTLLIRPNGSSFASRYGLASAARHVRAGALELADADPCLRHDVDVLSDLGEMARLGVGPATARWLARANVPKDSALPATALRSCRAG